MTGPQVFELTWAFPDRLYPELMPHAERRLHDDLDRRAGFGDWVFRGQEWTTRDDTLTLHVWAVGR